MDIEGLLWQEGWTPTTDLEVTHMMNLLKEKEKEKDKIVTTAKEEIKYLEEVGAEAESKYDRVRSRIEYLLGQYIENEVDEADKKVTATQIKYKIARGEIVVSKPSKELLKPSKDDEAMLEVMYPNLFETVVNLKWAELKKRLEIANDGEVIDKETGKKVTSFVPVKEVPSSIKIKLK